MALDTFSKYLAEARKAKGLPAEGIKGLSVTPATSSLSEEQLNIARKAIGANAKQTGTDFLGRLVAGLSTPMYAMENIASKVSDEQAKLIQAQQQGKAYDFLGGVGNVITAPMRGAAAGIATAIGSGGNVSDMPTGSRLLEQFTDVAGMQDPNYVDVQNNVNPVAAGAGGLAIDILADPLTWIPGVAYAKAGNLAAQGARKVLGITKPTEEAARLAAEARLGGTAAAVAAEAKASPFLDEAAANAELTAKLLDESPAVPLRTTQQTEEAATQAKAAEIPVAEAPAIPKAPSEIIDEAQFPVEPTVRPRTVGENLRSMLRGTERVTVRNVPFVKEPAQWAAAVREELIMASRSGIKLSNDQQSLLKNIENPEYVAKAHADYANKFEQYAGNVDLSGAPRLSSETLASPNKWLQYKAAVGNDDALVNITVNKKKLSFTPKDVTDALGANTKKLSKVALDKLKLAVQEAYTAEKATYVAATTRTPENAVAEMIRQMGTTGGRAAWSATVGPEIVQSVVKTTNPAKRAQIYANLVNLATDPNVLDTVTTSIIEADKTTARLVSHLASFDPAFANLPEYNRMRRIEISGVNDEARSALRRNVTKSRTDLEKYVAALYSDMPADRLAHVTAVTDNWLRERFALREMPFTTDDVTIKRSLEQMGEGVAFRSTEFNQMDTYSLLRDLSKKYEVEAKALGYFGDKRANFVKSNVMGDATMVEHVMDSLGAPLVMRNFDDVGKSVYWLSPTQLIAAIDDVNPRLANMLFFNGETSVPFTRVADAVVAQMDSTKKLSRKQFDNLATGNIQYDRGRALGQADDVIAKRLAKEPQGFISGGTYGKKGATVSGEELLSQTYKALDEITNRTKGYHAENSAAFSTRFGKEYVELTDKHFTELAALAANPSMMADHIRAVHQLSQIVVDNADAAGVINLAKIHAIEEQIGAVPGTIRKISSAQFKGKAAADAAETKLLKVPKTKKGKPVSPEDIDMARAEAAKPHKLAGIEAAQETARKNFDEAAPFNEVISTASKLEQEALRIDTQIQANAARMASPLSTAVTRGQSVTDWFRKRFDATYQNERLYDERHASANMLQEFRQAYRDKLGAIKKAYAADDIERAFSNLQNDIIPGDDIAKLQDELASVVKEMHGIGTKQFFESDAMLRDGDSLATVNYYLKRAGAPEYDIQEIAALAKTENISLGEAAAKSWKTQVITDPIKYLDARNFALLEMGMHQGVAASFWDLAKRNDWIVSAKAPGYVSVDDMQGVVLQFVPKGSYIDARLVEELKTVENILNESRSASGRLGEFVDKYYTPWLGWWKAGVTYMRPGHPVRNKSGSFIGQFMLEGLKHLRWSQNAALKVMAAHKTYDGFEPYKVLKGMGDIRNVHGGDVLFDSAHGKITSNQIFVAGHRYGLMPSMRASEDVIEGAPNAAADFIRTVSLQKSGYERMMAKLSEATDHHSRLAFFLQVMKKNANNPKFKSLEDLMDYASKRTKRGNPDTHGLTPFEARNMRLIFPFYNWFRGIMPAIVEMTFMHPGRFMALPKASYNMAVAMGVNPANLYDPFPEGGMFPSFLTEQIQGPVLKWGETYLGLNPGIVTFDVLNTLGPDPLHGIAGMTTPFIRVPAELISGSQWSTQAKIKDISDYLDAQIPGLGYVANITGYSPTSPFVEGELQQQLQVEKGNKTELDQGISAFNWLTGLGLLNYSKPNYVDYAEIEKRNKAAEEAKKNQ